MIRFSFFISDPLVYVSPSGSFPGGRDILSQLKSMNLGEAIQRIMERSQQKKIDNHTNHTNNNSNNNTTHNNNDIHTTNSDPNGFQR